MNNAAAWIVTVDGRAGRFFERLRPGAILSERSDRALRADDADVPRDRQPRVHDRLGPARHAVEPRVNPRREAERRFLVRVAEEINMAAEASLFSQLIICAPPRALGILRAHLSEAAQRLLTRTYHKDFVAADAADLDQRLRELAP